MSAAASIVAVVAHPDDECLIAGGTLALAARAGAETGIVSLTRGELGPIADPALATPANLGDVREGELRAAAARLGGSWAQCLRHPDGEVPWVDRAAAVAELADLLAAHQPTAVLTFGPDGVYGHADHAAAGEIAAAACDRLEVEGSVDRYESVWASDLVTSLCDDAAARGLPTGLWGLEPQAFGSWDARATLTIDVGSVLEQKLAALREHRTQLGPDHLLAALPADLAGRHLGQESWRQAGPRSGACVLADLLGARVTRWRA